MGKETVSFPKCAITPLLIGKQMKRWEKISSVSNILIILELSSLNDEDQQIVNSLKEKHNNGDFRGVRIEIICSYKGHSVKYQGIVLTVGTTGEFPAIRFHSMTNISDYSQTKLPLNLQYDETIMNINFNTWTLAVRD